MRNPSLLAAAGLLLAPAAGAQSIEDGLGAASSIVGQARAAAAARAAAPPPRAVDLRAQTAYPTGAPDQGAIGDCHAFAATVLLNAALHRAGRPARLSPADLFIQSILFTGEHHLYIAEGTPMSLTEAGFIAADLKVALANGVATESELPYSRFERAYAARILPSARRDIVRNDDTGVLTRALNLEQLDDEEAKLRAAAERETLRSKQAARTRALVERVFRRRWPEILNARERVKAELAAARVVPHEVDFTKPGSAAGGAVKRLLLAELDAGRPVAVEFDMAGSALWSEKAAALGGSSGGHGFVLVGYRAAGGELAFETLNSWGPDGNFPLPESALGYVMTVSTLRPAGSGGR